jgi:hypothetical protein
MVAAWSMLAGTDMRWAGWMGTAALALASACGDRSPPPLARTLKALVAERMPSKPPLENRDRLPESQRRLRDAAVYLDGKPVGVLKRSELPPTLPLHKKKLSDGRLVPRYKMSEYLAAVGARLDRVRAVHFVGGRGRAALVEGDEVRARKDDLLFSFTKGMQGGKPRVHWPEGIKINTSIDAINTMMIYEEKPPPRFDSKARTFHFDQGPAIEGLPYVEAEAQPKGTRVYVDGVYAGVLKRKVLPDAFLAPDSMPSKPRFSLEKWLASVDLAKDAVKTVELLAGEHVVVRLSGADWERERQILSFSLPRRSQGKMMVRLSGTSGALVDAGAGSAPAEVKVSAIELYRKLTPPDRPLRPLADVVQKDRPGSDDAQGDDENPAKEGVPGSARGMHREED